MGKTQTENCSRFDLTPATFAVTLLPSVGSCRNTSGRFTKRPNLTPVKNAITSMNMLNHYIWLMLSFLLIRPRQDYHTKVWQILIIFSRGNPFPFHLQLSISLTDVRCATAWFVTTTTSTSVARSSSAGSALRGSGRGPRWRNTTRQHTRPPLSPTHARTGKYSKTSD